MWAIVTGALAGQPSPGPSEPTAGASTGPAAADPDPTEAAAGPAESAAGPAESAAGPAESAAGPAESAVDSAESTAGPAESTAGPTEAAAGPAEAAAGPTESTAGPTEPTAGPAEATVGPAVAHTAGVLLVTRAVEAALWPDPFAQPARWGSTWLETLRTPPTFDPGAPAFGWDGDPPAFNLVGHGLMGAELYYRPRRCGLSVAGSALFAALASATWEYAFEGNARAASAQDLVYTPLAGVVLGELRFRVVRDLGDRHRWLGPLLDPFGEAERRLGARC